MEMTNYVPGQFCWVDLQTTDVGSAKGFYSRLLGWDFRDIPTDLGPAYTMFIKNGLAAAGMAPQPPEAQEAGAPPLWSSYIRVENAAETIAKTLQLGGRLVMPAMKAMDQGSFAVLEDPTGAAFGLWQPDKHIGAGWVNDPGGFCWNELYTRDIEGARSFYEKLFDWEFQHSQPGGREYWTIKNSGHPNGGMMEIRPEWGEVPPNWSVYFAVESCEGTVSEAVSLGAKLFLPAMDVPEVGSFAGLQDPQGAHFLVIELLKQA